MHPRHPWAAAAARTAASPAVPPPPLTSRANPADREGQADTVDSPHAVARGPAQHPQGSWAYTQHPGPEAHAHQAQQNYYYYAQQQPPPHRPSLYQSYGAPSTSRLYGSTSMPTASPSAGYSSGSSGSYTEDTSKAGAMSRKRPWDDTVDPAGGVGDEHARARAPPVVLYGNQTGSSAGDGRLYGQHGGNGGEVNILPSPTSAGCVSQGSYYGSSSEGATPAPATQASYNRAPSSFGSNLHPMYAQSHLGAEPTPPHGYTNAPPAASAPPFASPFAHSSTRPLSFSSTAVPPSPWHQDQRSPFASTDPLLSMSPASWAAQRAYSYEVPQTHSSAYRPPVASSLPAPSLSHDLPISHSQSPFSFPPPSIPTSRSSFSGPSHSYEAYSSADRPGQLSHLEAPAYPTRDQSRPATTSSIPSLSLSMPTPHPEFDPYHQDARGDGYQPSNAAEASYYPSPAGAQQSSLPYGYTLPPPIPSSSRALSHAHAEKQPHQREPSAPPKPPKPPSPPPTILPETIPQLQQASTARAIHRSSAPILAFNPAREPASTGKQLVQSSYGVTYAVASSGQSKGKAKSAEVGAVCYTCSKHRAKVVLRGNDLSGWAPRLNYSCLDCLPVHEQKRDEDPDVRRQRLAERAFEADCAAENGADRSPSGSAASAATSGSALLAGLPGPTEHDRATFKDSFSGAVDYIEGGPGQDGAVGADGQQQGDSRLQLPPEETSRALPAHLKRQALVCDVCDRTIGVGSISSLTPGAPPAFTVEIICDNCADKYKPCSDCGGGGGRLTPGRWRCKELFPAGRRTCTLSHARNPPLSDIDYDVLRVTEIDPLKLEALDARCRLVYFNTRLRTQARPEMLERGDGLATTYAQCEKLVVDGWSLLKPLMSVDVEASKGMRRYVAVQTSTPHRRRAKPKPGAPPRPEPELEDPLEKEVSGFLLVEHDLKNGATFVAVAMPWAISGDAFDATTILLDETVKRIRTDLRHDNALRREHGERPYPEPWCLWGVTPFKADSRMTQSLSRRSFVFLEEYMRDKPDLDLSIFPPTREIHIPNEFVKTFKIFIRDMTDDDGGDTPAPGSTSASKKQPRQRARKLKAM